MGSGGSKVGEVTAQSPLELKSGHRIPWVVTVADSVSTPVQCAGNTGGTGFFFFSDFLLLGLNSHQRASETMLK